MDKQNVYDEDQQRFMEMVKTDPELINGKQRLQAIMDQEKTREILIKTRPENISEAIASAGIAYDPDEDRAMLARSSVNRQTLEKIKKKKAQQKKSRRRNRKK